MKYLPSELHGVEEFNQGDCRRQAALVAQPGDWAEFGVSSGNSARQLIEAAPEGTRLFLLDWYKGLPSDWWHDDHHKIPKGKYSCSSPPTFDEENVVMLNGLFEETIPSLVESCSTLSLMHIDCDLYESARQVFFGCNSLIVPGTIILMDEYWGYQYYRVNEWLAFNEWVSDCKRRVQWLFRGSKCAACAKVIR